MSDGRVRRSMRSRESTVDALFAPVGEGVLQPTAQRVADRSGLTIRTVFRHFSDMESLLAAVDARVQEEAAPLLLGKRPDGTVDERIRGLVAFRGALFERIAPNGTRLLPLDIRRTGPPDPRSPVANLFLVCTGRTLYTVGNRLLQGGCSARRPSAAMFA